jgi:hypothetical protein
MPYTNPLQNMFGNMGLDPKLYNSQAPQAPMPTENPYGFGNLDSGQELKKRIMEMIANGLPSDVRANLERQGLGAISGNVAAGKRSIEENTGAGTSTGARTSALSKMYGAAGTQRKDLYGDIANKEMAGRTAGFDIYSNLASLAAGIGQNKAGNKLSEKQLALQRDALNFQKQQYDDESGFSFGGLLGDIIGGAGTVLGGAASAGTLCCFIFLEAYNGNMPWFVRECRDEFAPESSERRAGYIKMAGWLVPLMQKYKIVRMTVNGLMIKPLTRWGGYYKKVKGYEYGFIFRPFVKAWFWIWKKYGTKNKR